MIIKELNGIKKYTEEIAKEIWREIAISTGASIGKKGCVKRVQKLITRIDKRIQNLEKLLMFLPLFLN